MRQGDPAPPERLLRWARRNRLPCGDVPTEPPARAVRQTPEASIAVTEELTGAQRSAVYELLDAARHFDDHEALGEPKRIDLRSESASFVALLAYRNGTLAAYGHIHQQRTDQRHVHHGTDASGRDAGLLDQPGPRDEASREFAIEIALHPDERVQGHEWRRRLLAAAVEEIARRGGGIARYWCARATPDDDADAGQLGFVRERDLIQMRVALPIPSEIARAHARVAVRPFKPGTDEAEWLEVNNRAFATHPEQGRWDLATLLAHEREPWFDPNGFLVHEEGGRIAGSCWTKVHNDHSPPLGEIYVISVDPSHQGRGLGRALTIAGFEWLAAAGIRHGMLYVDAANEPALSLYTEIGMVADHRDRCYRRAVSAR